MRRTITVKIELTALNPSSQFLPDVLERVIQQAINERTTVRHSEDFRADHVSCLSLAPSLGL